MRLLFCSEFFHPSVGGVQEVVRQIAVRMVKAGHEVTVVTSSLMERTSNECYGVTIKPFSVSGNMVNGMVGEVDAYRRFLIESDFDVLFVYAAQQWTFDALWEVLPDLRMHKVIVPCGYSGLVNPTYRSYFAELPSILAQFDAIVYHAQNYRDYAFGEQHGLNDKAVVIPNGADDQEFLKMQDPGFRRSLSIPDDAVMLMTVGALNGAKGHLELAQAFEQLDLAGKPTVLVLNGNHLPTQSKHSMAGLARRTRHFVQAHGPMQLFRIGATRLFAKLGMHTGYDGVLQRCVERINRSEGRKVIICNLDRQDLVQAYLTADLFVFASHIEYSPLVLYEACAAGLPFISVSVGNASEIADWTGGGIVLDVDPDSKGLRKISPQKLAEAVRRLLDDKPHRNSLGASGRRAWQERFNWGTLAQEYMQLFERVCAKEKRDSGSV